MTRTPHGVAVDIWAIGMLVLQLLSGYQPVEPIDDSCTERDIANLVVSVNLQRTGQVKGPISQNGIDFILACLTLQPHARPTAAGAAKHPWLRESADEVLLFKEREKKLHWKPRGIIIPTVVRLQDVGSDPTTRHTASKEKQRVPDEETAVSPGRKNADDQNVASERIPDSVQGSQISDSNLRCSEEWIKKRVGTTIGFKRPRSVMSRRGASFF